MTSGRYGGFWRRFLAYGIDGFILYLISLILFAIGILALALGGVAFEDILTNGDLPQGMGLFLVVYTVTTFITAMAYFTWFHGTGGQTPGKMLMRLRVIQVTGAEMTLGIAFLRWAGSLISSLVLCLGFLWIAFDRKKQGWHDKIAATLVVHARSKPVSDPPPLSPTLTDTAASGTGLSGEAPSAADSECTPESEAGSAGLKND